MQYRILGPLEVLEGERAIALARQKERALLAVLLLHANDVVPRDRLIDELWGSEPPETARTALQVHVSQLRKLLGHETIVTRAPGYLIRVGAEELDAGRFGRLVAEARTRDPERAAEALRQALSLWRGPALADLEDSVARPERARLDDERLAAVEQRIGAELALGLDEELVPELEELVREQPLRERLRGQLMLALYRSGRQAEALEVYRQGRRLLMEELGLEPGEELRRLEQAILAQDPAMAPMPHPRIAAERRRTRLVRHSRVIAVLGGLLLAGAIAGIVVGLTGTSSGPVTVAANSVAVVDPETNRVVEDVPVGSRPVALAVGEGAVWVANADDGTVSRIDPRTRKVVKTIGLGPPASDIAVGGGSVWVANGSEGTVTRIDPRSSTPYEPPLDLGGPDELVPAGAYSVAAGEGAVWVGSGQGKVFRVDPARGEAVASVPTGQTPTDLAAGEGAVWALSQAGRALRIEARTNAVIGSVAAGSFPVAVAAGAGSVWVGELGDPDGTIWQIDPETMTVAGTISVPGAPLGITARPDAVWVAGGRAGTLTRIDPRTGMVVRTIRLGNVPLDVAVGDGRVWVAVSGPEAGA